MEGESELEAHCLPCNEIFIGCEECSNDGKCLTYG